MPVERDQTILIADELAPARQVLRQTLEGLHFKHFVEVDHGEAAWQALEQQPIGLVLSEWHLPKRSALSLLEEMQCHETLAKVPLVLVTTESDAEKVRLAIEQGVSGYVLKPYDHFTLMEQIEEAFARKMLLFPFG